MTSNDALLANLRRLFKMLCFLVTGKYELKLGNKRIILRIKESDLRYFAECERNKKEIVVSFTPLAFTNDYILKRTVCHEFIHCLFNCYSWTDAVEHLKKLVICAIDMLSGNDPYTKEVGGEEYKCSEEQYCFFLETVLSLLLYVAPEWDVIREDEHKIYAERVGGVSHVTKIAALQSKDKHTAQKAKGKPAN